MKLVQHCASLVTLGVSFKLSKTQFLHLEIKIITTLLTSLSDRAVVKLKWVNEYNCSLKSLVLCWFCVGKPPLVLTLLFSQVSIYVLQLSWSSQQSYHPLISPNSWSVCLRLFCIFSSFVIYVRVLFSVLACELLEGLCNTHKTYKKLA